MRASYQFHFSILIHGCILLFDICQVLYFFHIYLKAQQEPAEPDNQKKEQNKIVWTSNDTSK